MKLFEKVLNNLGIFSKEFEESLDVTAQEEREKSQKLWENFANPTSEIPIPEIKKCNIKHTAGGTIKYLSNKESLGLHEEFSIGKKFDTGKLSYTLLPWKAITEVVSILEFGKQKYGRDNWKKVPNAKERYLDACFRHLISYVEGETYDPESGKHHLAHAVCCLLFVLWFDRKGKV